MRLRPPRRRPGRRRARRRRRPGRDRVVASGPTRATRPADLVEHLLAPRRPLRRGARRAGPAARLGDLPDLAVPDDVEVRVVDDLDTAARRRPPSASRSSAAQRSTDEELLSSWPGPTPADCTSGSPTATARPWPPPGCTPREAPPAVGRRGAARGARGTRRLPRPARPPAGGSGAEHGCALALVKGRLETSAPVLRPGRLRGATAPSSSYRLPG